MPSHTDINFALATIGSSALLALANFSSSYFSSHRAVPVVFSLNGSHLVTAINCAKTAILTYTARILLFNAAIIYLRKIRAAASNRNASATAAAQAKRNGNNNQQQRTSSSSSPSTANKSNDGGSPITSSPQPTSVQAMEEQEGYLSTTSFLTDHVMPRLDAVFFLRVASVIALYHQIIAQRVALGDGGAQPMAWVSKLFAAVLTARLVAQAVFSIESWVVLD